MMTEWKGWHGILIRIDHRGVIGHFHGTEGSLWPLESECASLKGVAAARGRREKAGRGGKAASDNHANRLQDAGESNGAHLRRMEALVGRRADPAVAKPPWQLEQSGTRVQTSEPT